MKALAALHRALLMRHTFFPSRPEEYFPTRKWASSAGVHSCISAGATDLMIARSEGSGGRFSTARFAMFTAARKTSLRVGPAPGNMRYVLPLLGRQRQSGPQVGRYAMFRLGSPQAVLVLLRGRQK
jgi:hypothetical protein